MVPEIPLTHDATGGDQETLQGCGAHGRSPASYHRHRAQCDAGPHPHGCRLAGGHERLLGPPPLEGSILLRDLPADSRLPQAVPPGSFLEPWEILPHRGRRRRRYRDQLRQKPSIPTGHPRWVSGDRLGPGSPGIYAGEDVTKGKHLFDKKGMQLISFTAGSVLIRAYERGNRMYTALVSRG